MRSQGTKKPTRSGVGLVLSESVRQVIDDDDDIDPVGRSVGRSVTQAGGITSPQWRHV